MTAQTPIHEKNGDETTASPAIQPCKRHPAAIRPHGLFWVSRPTRVRMLEWAGEIVVVFIGVSAAFLLSAWQAHRQDRANHLQILDSMERELSREVQHAREEAAASQEAINQFRHELAAGEMPALHLMVFTSDYDPADDVALSQAGADHLLNFDTIEALKQLRKVERMGLMLMHNYQQLANELLAPRLNDPREKFYDLQTKQLQAMFAWYPRAKEDSNRFVQDYVAASEALLIQVRRERTKLR